MLKSSNKKGFSLIELVVILAIVAVFAAVLAPALLKYVENSRIQKDESAMDEICNAVQLAISDSATYDEVCSYALPNNYITYSDSSGNYASVYEDEEYWAPDGSGYAVTITFNPDENGDYILANGLINNMTFGNGSVAEQRTSDESKTCLLSEMGDQKLYAALKSTIGESFTDKSATYENSSYTIFIKLNKVAEMKQADVYGSYNGTNLSPDCPAAIGSGTSEYTPEGEAIVTKPTGGTQAPNYSNSDLQGSGGGGVTGNNPNPTPETPSKPEEDVVEEKCNLYFGEKYSAIVDGTKVTAIFYEDTSAKMYIDGSLEQEFPAGYISYGPSTVDLSAINFGIGTISTDGKKINVDGIMLVLEESKLHFGVPYTNMDAGYAISLVAYEDGRAEIWAYRFWKQDSYPAGTFTYEDNKVITEGIAIAIVSPDGMQVEYEGMTFDLDTSWCPHGDTYMTGETDKYTGDEVCVYCGEVVNEGECKHANTELQNVVDGYTGDKICLDCGKILNKGICSHINTEIRNKIDATCIKTGYSGDKTCLQCNKLIEKGKTINKTDHQETYIEGETDTYTGDEICTYCETIVKLGQCKHRDNDKNNICDICGTECYANGTLVFKTDGTAYLYGENWTVSNSYTGWMNKEYTHSTPWYSDRDKITMAIIQDGVSPKSTAYWFWSCTNLSSVSIPNSVTKIGNITFKGCTNLKQINLPDSITFIGETAFMDCKNLSSITIPSGVNNIGIQPFRGCVNLTTITVADNNATYYSENNCIIEKSSKTLITGCKTSVIPDDVRAIKPYAFIECDGLTNMVIPNSVTSIGQSAFCYCYDLTNVTISNSVTTIEEMAFYGCSGLKSVTINGEGQLKSIGKQAFAGCKELTSITIPGNTTSIGHLAFNGCPKLTNINLCEGVSNIGESAFMDCKNLISLTLPSSIKQISTKAFSGCSALQNINFNGTVAQWNAISKANSQYTCWYSGTPATQVICSDGTVALS